MTDGVFFTDLIENNLPDEAVLDISETGKVLIISDFHMGWGSSDDLNGNGKMLACLLEDYYFRNGWHLILNGDIEELQKYSFDKIYEKWACLYRTFDLFAEERRLHKIAGNHDDLPLLKRSASTYPIYQAVRIETGSVPAYVYHGHQLSNIYTRYNGLMGMMIRYFLKPFRIKNISAARNPYRRFSVEKTAYAYSLKNRCLSIIGHTHRPLFESLGRFDYIKFEIERLCRDYPASEGSEKTRIENEVTALRNELSKLKRKERRDVLRQSLYGDELPVPCLFNSGCVLGKKGINAIEMTKDEISLIYWYEEGKSKKFITRGGYKIEEMPDSPYRRTVLNHSKLDYVYARINLLGSHLN